MALSARASSIGGVLILVLGLLSLALVLAAAVFAIRRGIALYGQVRASVAAMGDATRAVSYATAALATLGLDTSPLDRSLARLAASRAQLRVLLAALADARAAAGRLGDVVPRK